MRRLRRFAAHMPITVKVPIVVVLLMLAIGVAVSERVLSRLITSQERQLGDLANAYLDGLASPLIEPILRGDPWEIFDILDQAKRVYAAVKPVETIVTDAGGHRSRQFESAARRHRLALAGRFSGERGSSSRRSSSARPTRARSSIGSSWSRAARSARFMPSSTSRRCLPSGARCCGRSSASNAVADAVPGRPRLVCRAPHGGAHEDAGRAPRDGRVGWFRRADPGKLDSGRQHRDRQAVSQLQPDGPCRRRAARR